MLKPAILYKEQLEHRLAEQLYTDEYFWYSGYGSCNELPIIKPQDSCFQWAIIGENENVEGYFAYQIQPETDTVLNFGLYSFNGNGLYVVNSVLKKMNELVNEHRRVEWRMVGGNPIQEAYDRFCKKNGGNIVMLHQVTKDIHGKWHDEYIYEIVKGESYEDCREEGSESKNS